ncbi:MAG: 4'-phosphopantetheinyl transferase superfamily protein, partial [Pirellulales bacterium]|nr:4'-phosphopantetheinyl transferase superfamily protein [Pirellulales bacterium]
MKKEPAKSETTQTQAKRAKSPIASLFPDEVVTVEVHGEQIEGALYPEENSLIRNAVPKRKREFTAGRLCARRALEILSITDFPIVMNENRTPVWPPGIVGSITHTEGYSGVAIARQEEIRSIGLDVEGIEKLDRKLWKMIGTGEELAGLDSLSQKDRELRMALLFSAKESLYKCQYAVSGQWLGYHDVAVSVDPVREEFSAKFLVEVSGIAAKRECFKGRYLFSRGFVFTGMILR